MDVQETDKPFSVEVAPTYFAHILTNSAKEKGEISSNEALEIVEMFYNEENGTIGFNGFVRKVVLN